MLVKRLLRCVLPLLIVAFPVAAAGQDGTKRTVPQLLKDLKSTDYEQAWSAARELGQFPQSKAQAVPALIQALNNEWSQCSGDIREAIADSLAVLKAKEAVFPLLRLLQSGKSVDHECAECGCCFLALTPGDVIQERGFDPFCANSLLGAIYRLADFSHSKLMADIVAQGKYRPELLVTIGKVGLPRYANFISRYKDDPEVEVRRAVAQALGLIENDPVTIPVLIQLLSRGTEDFLVKWEASNSLIAMGKKGKAPAIQGRLMPLLKERDTISVALAARALTLLGERAGAQKLRELAADKDPRVRSEAVLYLGEAADADSKAILLKGLGDDNLAVRGNALYAVGRIGDASNIPTVNKAFEDSQSYQEELAKRLKAGASEATLRDQYGYEAYDLRQTLQEAVDTIRKGSAKN